MTQWVVAFAGGLRYKGISVLRYMKNRAIGNIAGRHGYLQFACFGWPSDNFGISAVYTVNSEYEKGNIMDLTARN